ncbi:MAG: hypothetical protein HFJ79_09470 [Clostridiales bacterium]|nr:hypothetical protein [Clostridiales bacterium]
MQDKVRLPLDDKNEQLFDEMYPVASSMECTGLIPAAPATESEVESYSEIYDIPLAKDKKDANNRMQNLKVSDTPTPTKE